MIMIQKISSNEYLKRVEKMTAAEKRALLDRVGQWLRDAGRMLMARAGDPMARLQNVMQVSGWWNDAECKAWTEGVKLLTAFVAVGDTWLPDMIYNKAAKRSIKKIHDVLSAAIADRQAAAVKVSADGLNQGGTAAKEEHAEGTVSATHAVAAKAATAKEPKTEKKTVSPVKNSKPAVVRPRHIDQYVHLLPEKTQEKAATVKGLLRDLDTARENMRKLMEAGEHSDKTAQWARTAARIDEKVKNIYKELDAEWEKLVKSGTVSVDAFGNATVNTPPAEDKTASEKEPAKKPGRQPMTDEQKAAKKAEKEARKKANNARKAALVRKWLIDTRNAKTDDQKKKWIAKYKEMVKLGGDDTVTDKVLEAAKYYDINLEGLKN